MNRKKYIYSFYKGCLLGGAIGDALGYKVEFLSHKEIESKYGPGGIRIYDEPALISDDTQMTLFTAIGLLNGETKGSYKGVQAPLYTYVYYSYLDWLLTQGIDKPCKDPKRIDSWLMDVKELHNQRCHGRTCISSLMMGDEEHKYNLLNPINDSKGCGAVTRIAPVGLVFKRLKKPLLVAAEIGALTHGHPMSHLSCQLMTLIIKNIFKYSDRTLWRTIQDSVRELHIFYEKNPMDKTLIPFYNRMREYLPNFIDLMKKALILVRHALVIQELHKNEKDLENIKSLGEGWVAEEALAIAIYCAARFQGNPMEGILAAVNHDGDSDSTGALAGQILGAYYGEGSFPDTFTKPLEIVDVIKEVAIDLATGCKFDSYSKETKEKDIWETKYLKHHRYIRS